MRPGWALQSATRSATVFAGCAGFADQQVRRHADQHDRHEIALGVVAQLRLQARRERMAVDVRHQQHAAVARLGRDIVGREHAGDAGLGLDDDLLVPHHAELLADDAGQRIGAAAGRKADDDAHRAVRPGLRVKARNAEGGGGACGSLQDGTSLHGFSDEMKSGTRAQAAACSRSCARMRREELHRRLHAAAGERDAARASTPSRRRRARPSA